MTEWPQQYIDIAYTREYDYIFKYIATKYCIALLVSVF